MSVSFQPPVLEYHAGTLAEKLYKRLDWQPEKQPVGFVCTDFENMRKGAGIGGLLISGIVSLFVGGVRNDQWFHIIYL
jgi:hypothetical protein